MAVFFLTAAQPATGQIQVQAGLTAQALISKLAGPGVVVLNPSLNCPSRANGVFTALNAGLGLDSGIVLTTGRAATLGNDYGVSGGSGYLASANNGAPGDPQLDGLAGVATHDACALEFDVIPQGDTMKFDYVFSSEEYINATCGPYNDAFAFFISGPGISGQPNLARVPGTNIPVTINSINSGVPGPGYTLANCTAMGPGSPFTSYYIDNAFGSYLTHRGFTTVLQALQPVIPCSTYHLKMVIADGGNFVYDSGVFLKAGSLQASTLNVRASGVEVPHPAAGPVAYAVKGCTPGTFRITRPQAKPTPQTVRYFIAGNAVNGYDYVTIADSAIIPANDTAVQVSIVGLPTPVAGVREVKLLIRSLNLCTGAGMIADSASLLLLDTITANILSPDTVLCHGEAFTIRTDIDSQLTFQWSPLVGMDDPKSAFPQVQPLTSTTYRLTVSWPEAGCAPKSDRIGVTVMPAPVVRAGSVVRVCLHGTAHLDVDPQPPYAGYLYQWTGPDGFSAHTQQPVVADVTTADTGYYVVTVGLDTSRCTSTDSMRVSLRHIDAPVVRPLVLCLGKPAAPLQGPGYGLLWYNAPEGGAGSGTPPVPATVGEGVTRYYVSRVIGDCESERSELPVTVRKCCEGGVYIPTAFTPDGDGRNDLFRPKFGFGYQVYRFRVFNRWGQVVFQTVGDNGWEGTQYGTPAPAGAYYYELIVTCLEGGQQTFTGDVTLVR